MKQKEGIILLVSVGVSAGLVLVMSLAFRKKHRPLPDTSVFDSPDQPGSGRCMDIEFLRMLQALEEKTGYQIFQNINSGARSAAHNAKVGGVNSSSHKIPTCRAADIHVPNRDVQEELVYVAKAVGFKRIGVGRTFVHLDNDPEKPQNVAWGYPKGARPAFNPF